MSYILTDTCLNWQIKPLIHFAQSQTYPLISLLVLGKPDCIKEIKQMCQVVNESKRGAMFFGYRHSWKIYFFVGYCITLGYLLIPQKESSKPPIQILFLGKSNRTLAPRNQLYMWVATALHTSLTPLQITPTLTPLCAVLYLYTLS